MKNKNYFSLIMFIVSLISISSAIGYFAMPPIDGWYKVIRSSSLTPQN
jgi:hypothetical protein